MTIHFTDEPQPTGEVPIMKDGGRRVRLGPLLLGVFGLSVVGILLAARWGSPGHRLTLALAGLMPILVPIPLMIGAIGAWFSRSNAARAGAAVVIGVCIFTTSPIDAVIGCRADSGTLVGSDQTITVYTANVFFESDGGRPADVARSIIAERSDVVVLQEVTWDFLTGLRSESGLEDYVHRADDIAGTGIDEVIWSRWPLVDVTLRPIADQRFLEATIAGPNGDFTVTAVHTQAPISAQDIDRWKQQHSALQTVDSTSPRLMAGDFNATMDHRPFRTLVNLGWTDVHERKGCGMDNTWPVDQGLPFPVMRLDHVLVTDHFEVLDVRFGDPGGSDHLPVVTTLELTGVTRD